MGNPFQHTRDLIKFKISLSVLLGELEPRLAEVWLEAFESLDDAQMQELMALIESLDTTQACKVTLRYLMDNHYPFRELILFETDDAFKRRMGLEDYSGPDSLSN